MNFLELSLRLNGFHIGLAKQELPRLVGKEIMRRDEIVEFHRQHNPLYKALIEKLEINKFEDLPIITKRDFQRPIEHMISDVYRLKDLFISNTSGSSGHPFFFAKNKYSHAITHAIILNCYAEHGITPKLKQARFYGIPLNGLSKYRERVKDCLCNRVRFHVFDLSDKQLNVYLRRFKKQKFGYVYGYTSAIVQFAKFLIRNSVILKDVCPSLKCCIVTSEVCTPEDRATIEKALGVKVVNEYGCSEAGLIAFEGITGVWHMVEEDSYYEVVDDDGSVLPWGQEGRILITSLSNKAMPIIRYEVGDVGIIDNIDGRLILRKLSGRVSDIVLLPSGRSAAGLTFYYISRSILEKNSVVREFIVRQTAIDTFVFDMVTDRELIADEIAFLQAKLHEYLEPNLKLVINRVDKINRPASGKIKHFYSELP